MTSLHAAHGRLAAGHNKPERIISALPARIIRRFRQQAGRQHDTPCRSHAETQQGTAVSTVSPQHDHGSTVQEPDVQPGLQAAWHLLKEFTGSTFRGLGAQYTATPEKRRAMLHTLLVRLVSCAINLSVTFACN